MAGGVTTNFVADERILRAAHNLRMCCANYIRSDIDIVRQDKPGERGGCETIICAVVA